MSEGSFFLQALIYLGAALLMVPIAQRVGLGSVLGYLIAGIAIGPAFLGFVGEEGQSLLHFAEFGVVMMLFLIGLELELPMLWKLKSWLLGLGGLQVLGTTFVFFFVFLGFSFSWQSSLALGMVLSLSSTAIVLQTIHEKGIMKTPAGQGSFSILLFQDMAVIPMLAIFPLLVLEENRKSMQEGSHSLISHWNGFLQGAVIISVIIAIIVSGRFLLGPLFRILASSKIREVFTAASLFLIISISLIMEMIGLSAALGTFLAGVVLASSEFRHELESNLAPFKGLLLGLFFISVGASIDLALVLSEINLVCALVFGIIFGKGLVLILLSRIFRFSWDQGLWLAFALSQVGEFSFVLFGFVQKTQILPESIVRLLIAAVAITMALTPILIMFLEQLILPVLNKNPGNKREEDYIHSGDNEILIAGFGRFGNMAGRFLRGNQISLTIIDFDADRVDVLRSFGFQVYYGDPTRIELLESAGIHKAKIFIASLDGFEKQKELVEKVKHAFPHLKVIARAGDREEAYTLKELGADFVVRETQESAVRAGMMALHSLGFRRHSIQKSSQTFLRHDNYMFEELFEHRNDRKKYVSLAKQGTTELERLMKMDLEEKQDDAGASW